MVTYLVWGKLFNYRNARPNGDLTTLYSALLQRLSTVL